MGKRRGGLRDDTKRVTSIVMIRRCFQAKRKRVHPCHRTARHPTHTRDITIDYEASAAPEIFPHLVRSEEVVIFRPLSFTVHPRSCIAASMT
jgi:hypothetical protein